MKAKYKKRLLKLAAHLESGNLGHEKFDFRVFNAVEAEPVSPGVEKTLAQQPPTVLPENFVQQPEAGTCGTMGCALAEMPIVDKRNWMFGPEGEPLLKDGNPLITPNKLSLQAPVYWSTPFGDACLYFDLQRTQVEHLFQPNRQMPDLYGGKRLKGDASADDVAANIRALVAIESKKTAERKKFEARQRRIARKQIIREIERAASEDYKVKRYSAVEKLMDKAFGKDK